MNTTFRLGRVGVVTLLLGAAAAMPALAHHSFAIFNMEQTRVFTGVVTRINPDANHLQIFFVPMNDERKGVLRSEDGKPMVWAVEMAGSAQAATQGISVNSLPPGTYISVALHPLRSGEAAGSRAETGNADDILGAATRTAFLPATIQDRRHVETFARFDERADTFRAAQLVRSNREKVCTERIDIA